MIQNTVLYKYFHIIFGWQPTNLPYLFDRHEQTTVPEKDLNYFTQFYPS